MYKIEIHCPNLSPFRHCIFMVRRSGIICGPIWGSFPASGDHLQFNLGIISDPGIVCGPGSFAGLYSTPGDFEIHFRSWVLTMGVQNSKDVECT